MRRPLTARPLVGDSLRAEGAASGGRLSVGVKNVIQPQNQEHAYAQPGNQEPHLPVV